MKFKDVKPLRGIPKLAIIFDDEQGLPPGDLFMIHGEADMSKSRDIKAYWKSRYGKIMKLHNRHDKVDEKITYAFQNGTFVPLVIHDLKTNITKFFDNGEEIEIPALIKKVRELISFL